MVEPVVIRRALCRVLSNGLANLVSTSSTASAFAWSPSALPPRVLIRHAIEHVFRIRMFRQLDARATRSLSEINPRIGDGWAVYARSEAVHDRYFLRDLRAMGLSREAVETMSPFEATLRLGRFIDACARARGPLPVVLYSFWAEQSSEAGSLPIIARNKEIFGLEGVRGASAHRNLDRNLDHVGVISDILAVIIRDTEDLIEAAGLLDTISHLIGEYFAELEAWNRSVSRDGGERRALNSRRLLAQT
jgi:hypothetical protein